jgi:hypothetical protein
MIFQKFGPKALCRFGKDGYYVGLFVLFFVFLAGLGASASLIPAHAVGIEHSFRSQLSTGPQAAPLCAEWEANAFPQCLRTSRWLTSQTSPSALEWGMSGMASTSASGIEQCVSYAPKPVIRVGLEIRWFAPPNRTTTRLWGFTASQKDVNSATRSPQTRSDPHFACVQSIPNPQIRAKRPLQKKLTLPLVRELVWLLDVWAARRGTSR